MYVCVLLDVRDESAARYCHAEPRDPVDDDQPRVPAANDFPCCPTGVLPSILRLTFVIDCVMQAMSQMPGLGQGGMGANPMLMDPNMMMMMNNGFMNPYGGGGGGFGGAQGGLDFSSLMGGRNPNPTAAQPQVASLNEPPPETR